MHAVAIWVKQLILAFRQEVPANLRPVLAVSMCPAGSRGALAGLALTAYSYRMSAALKIHRLVVEDYLLGELASPIKHEYVGGIAYAMAGARNAHNRIVGNIFGSVFVRLRGKRCQPFNSDTKIRIHLPGEIRFYYPDVSVVCDPNLDDESFQGQPIVIFEVLTKGTRRIDEGEKKDAYHAIPSLAVHVLVEEETASVVVWRRTGDNFVPEAYDGLNAILPLPEIATELPLAEIYQAVRFVPEAES